MKKLKTNDEKKFITIMLLLLAFLFISPLLLTFTGSFMKNSEILGKFFELADKPLGFGKSILYFFLRFIPDTIYSKNYFEVLVNSNQFLKMLWNSVFLVLPIVAGQVLVSAMAAFVFAKVKFKGRETIFFIYIIMMMMPFQVTLVPNYFVLDWLGLLDTRGAIILPGVFSAFGVFLLRQFMMSIPDEYMESARIDGCSLVTIFFKVILPVSKGGIASLAILSFIDHWNMVEQPLIFLDNVGKHPLSIYLASVKSAEMGVLFAAGFIYLVPVVLMFIYGENYLIEGVSNSAIKS